MPCILLKHRRVQVQFLSACRWKQNNTKIQCYLEKAAEISGELNQRTGLENWGEISIGFNSGYITGEIWSHLTMSFRLRFLLVRADFLLVLSPALFTQGLLQVLSAVSIGSRFSIGSMMWDSLLSVLPYYLIITKLERQPERHISTTEAQDQDGAIRNQHGHKKKTFKGGTAIL